MAGHVTDTAHDVARLERAAAANLLEYVGTWRRVVPGASADSIPFAGGTAAFTGVGSPLTTAKGAGPVITSSELDRVEGFFDSHGVAEVTIEAAPWLTPATTALLLDRGYRVAGGEDVVTQEAGHVRAAAGGLPVEKVPAEEWPELMRQAFELPDDATWRMLCLVSAHLSGAQLLGVRDAAGAWIAGAQRVPAAGIQVLGGDGTLAHARGRGAQAALIAARSVGVPPAMLLAAEVEPGGTSQRNYFRAGFRLAYHRAHYRRVP